SRCRSVCHGGNLPAARASSDDRFADVLPRRRGAAGSDVALCARDGLDTLRCGGGNARRPTARCLPAGLAARVSKPRVRRQPDRSPWPARGSGGRGARAPDGSHQRRTDLGSRIPSGVRFRMAAEAMYTPLEFAMVRTPLLPVETYASLASDEDHLALL